MMVRRFFNFVAVSRTQRTWRLAILDQYLDAPLSFHRSRPAGQLLAHADADVETAASMLMPLAYSMSVVALVVVSLVSLLVVHPLFAFVALILFPVLAVLNQRYTRSVEAPAARAQAAVGVVSGIAHESLDGVFVVKTLGREDDEVERLAGASDVLRVERIEIGRLRASTCRSSTPCRTSGSWSCCCSGPGWSTRVLRRWVTWSGRWPCSTC